ncbi:hypothetical protein RAS2_21170 [Phycisphaerae bacterium RAS2]|nr:hypothetical protein RAS2_21170 [Phycisphaerae bacterium RAS2]
MTMGRTTALAFIGALAGIGLSGCKPNSRPPSSSNWTKLRAISICPQYVKSNDDLSGPTEIKTDVSIEDIGDLNQFAAITKSLEGSWEELDGAIGALPLLTFEATRNSGETEYFMVIGGNHILHSGWLARLSGEQSQFFRTLAQRAFEQHNNNRQ